MFEMSLEYDIPEEIVGLLAAEEIYSEICIRNIRLSSKFRSNLSAVCWNLSSRNTIGAE